MKITSLESFLANAGGRNFLFVRLNTNTGLTGIGEATLEWQEKAVQTLLHDWVEAQVLGRDPFDIEAVVGGMIRNQYQGGATVMTAISGVEIAMWDLIGKACQQPVYQLLGGRCHANIPAYANAWFAGAKTPEDYAERARDVVARGFQALKFDPFGVAWKELTAEEHETAVTLVARVRDAVGPDVKMMIEFHGRLSLPSAVETIREMEKFNPTWCEEPVAPESVELLAKVKNQVSSRISAGERHYNLAEFDRLMSLRGCRRRAAGHYPLRRNLRREENCDPGGGEGYSDRSPYLRGPGCPGGGSSFRHQHSEFPHPGGLQPIRRTLAKRVCPRVESLPERRVFPVR